MHGVHFTWDEHKRQANLSKHGLDFADAPALFEGPTFTFEDQREDYGELRFVSLGLLGLHVVVVVHTETESEIRLISMREANTHETLLFFRNLD